MRTDPTDTGGLFVGRRPGTRKVRYRDAPERGSSRRQHADDLVAHSLLGLMGLVCLSFWGPLPAAWLWIASQAELVLDSLFVAICVAFFGILISLFVALAACKRIDQAWILVRRAAGHDQRAGVIGKVFAITCGAGAALFTAWLLLFAGANFFGGGASV